MYVTPFEKQCQCPKCTGEFDIDRLSSYPGEHSSIMRAVPEFLFKDEKHLPKALQANAKIIFRPHGSDIGAKYGVRDYFRQIADTRTGTRNVYLNIIVTAHRKHASPIATLMKLLEEMKKRYIYEINVDYLKHHHRPEGEVMILSPVTLNMTVFKNNEPYHENVAMLTTEHILIRRKEIEHINTMLPYGYTTHALQRIWERASLNGDVFHQVMADAFRVMRERVACAYIAYAGEKMKVPDYLAIPFYDGILIVGKRRCWTENAQRRYGYKIGNQGLELLSYGSPLFGETASDQSMYERIGSVDWLAGTYMAAKDISNPDRLEAAREYEEWSETLSESVMPYLCERFEPACQQEIDRWMPRDQRQKLIEIQGRMNPRVDPLDERIYLYNKVDLTVAREIVTKYGGISPPKNLPY